MAKFAESSNLGKRVLPPGYSKARQRIDEMIFDGWLS